MGINSDWPKVWKSEGSEYVAPHVPRETKHIFIDGQILLMQSRIDTGWTTWRDLALGVFGRRVCSAHRIFEHVVLAFDNYRCTPVFKSIEQAKRVKHASTFPFQEGESLGDKLPDASVWASAMQNRAFKTHVICMIVGILLDHYQPPRRGTTLTVDFINTVRVEYRADGSSPHTVLDAHAELGESDIKFMRYVQESPKIVVDSIDSDVVLIAMLYTDRDARADIYVRRRATLPLGEVMVKNSAGPKRKRTGAEGYELVHIRTLLTVLHTSARQAVGPELVVRDKHLTCLLVTTMLLTGSDYSRGLPRIGPRKLWDALHVVVPTLLLCSSFDDDKGFVLDEQRTVDIFYVQIYYLEFAKHLSSDRIPYSELLAELRESRLSDTVKNNLPSPERLCTTVRNINWMHAYWQAHNELVPAPLDGSCGFTRSRTGAGVAFADEAD